MQIPCLQESPEVSLFTPRNLNLGQHVLPCLFLLFVASVKTKRPPRSINTDLHAHKEPCASQPHFELSGTYMRFIVPLC